MDDLKNEHARLAQKATYTRAIDKVQEAIVGLERAKASIQQDPSSAALNLTKLRQSIKQSFEGANDNLKQVNSGLKGYQKILDKSFRAPLDESDQDVLQPQSHLINRAIAMHLFREGHFNVATTFVNESVNNIPVIITPSHSDWDYTNENLHKQFSEMYHILDEIRNAHNLEPAIQWARMHSKVLQSRGSNIEFELCKLKFVSLFLGEIPVDDTEMDPVQRMLNAQLYARDTFSRYYLSNGKETRALLGALAFHENIPDSPYKHLFTLDGAWDRISTSFTREFCSLLGLSADSPLLIATTAGAVAVPILQRVKTLMRARKTEWTTESELAVEIQLPIEYRFHSIFVCPVSKEQATDANPPMMMPCGHVICKESLTNVSKGNTFKCPYCPQHSHHKQAKKVYF